MPARPAICASTLAMAVCISFAACRPTGPGNPAQTQAWFEDVTARSGLQFVHQVETSGQFLFSETMGSGAAWIDFDQDGRLDVFLISNVRPSSSNYNRLYHQDADGRFKDVSAGSGLESGGFGNGLAVGDVNNDGRPEILISEYDRLRLFLNKGGGRFEDVTAVAGLTNAHWSVGVAFTDYDRDGRLDLVVGNYLDYDSSQRCRDPRGQPDFCGPQGFRPTLIRLFRNIGNSESPTPQFEDATVSSGLSRAPGKAMQIVCADFNGDRWPDLFATDDALPNRLFVNQHDGTFSEEAIVRGIAYTGMGAPAANMGVAIGDVDDDGLFDLFVPHLTEENHTLWRQSARGYFRDVTAQAGLLNLPWHGTGFGTVFGDFNCDGALDLAIVNGRIRRPPAGTPKPKLMPGIEPFWSTYAEPAQLFANDGRGRFADVSAGNPEFCGEALVGRGLAMADFDNDGGIDLLFTGIAGPARIVRNRAPRGHWVGVQAIDPSLGGRDAYGAEVIMRAGTRQYWRLVQPGFSYASSNDPRAHIGLGSNASYDSILVHWPDGSSETFPGGTADRYIVLRRGTGSRSVL